MDNFFLYRFPHTRLWMFIPWDQDQSFIQLDEAPSWNMAQNILARKIWDEPKYRDRYLAAIVAVGASVSAPAGSDPSSGWLEQEVLYDAAQVRDALYQDPLKQYSNDQFEQAVVLMQQFGRQRDAYERGFVGQIAPELLNVNTVVANLIDPEPTVSGEPLSAEVKDLIEQRQFDKALERAVDYTRKNPRDPLGYNLQGAVFFAKQDHANARKACCLP